jgi:hypothetical protein
MPFEDIVKEDFSKTFQEKAKSIPIESIGLPRRALNIIKEFEAKNSFEAITIINNHFPNINGVSKKTRVDCMYIVSTFIENVETATACEIKKLIDPRDEFLSSVNGNIADAFPALIALYLSKKSKSNYERNKDILNKRFGLNGNKKYTLESLGTFYNLTRERIRQIEAEMISEIHLLLTDDLNQKGWKLCPSIIQNFNTVSNKFHDFSAILLKNDVEHTLHHYFNKSLPSEYLDLFMKVCGYVKMPNSFNGFRGLIFESWIISSNYKKKELESIFQALDIIYNDVSPIPIFELTVLVKKKLKSKSKVLNQSISIALSSIKDIEYDGEFILIKFSRLRSAADKAFRVLESHKKPIHFSKITQEINILSKNFIDFTPILETNLKNQLVTDDRFFPIGRSGEWALKKWDNLNNLTIVQAIEQVLHLSGKSLKFSELEKGVMKIRPDASVKSLKVYLNDPKLFTRVGINEFALKTWRIKPAPKKQLNNTVTAIEFTTAVKSALLESNPIDFPCLIKLIIKSTGLSQASVRQKALALSGIEIKSQQGKRCKVVYCSDINLIVPRKEKTLIRDLVQLEVQTILFKQPNVPFIKGDLYNEVVKKVTCKRPTFYQYLDKMKGIYQYNENNKFYAVYKHEESIDEVEENVNNSVIN